MLFYDIFIGGFEHIEYINLAYIFFIRDCLQIYPLILHEFKQINQVLFLLKSLENPWFSDDFRRNRNNLRIFRTSQSSPE